MDTFISDFSFFVFRLVAALADGLPGSTNAFFEAKCPGVQVAIYAQMVWSMMFNAFLFAFFFATLSKSENRAYQVVFSNQIVISVTKTSGGDDTSESGRSIAHAGSSSELNKKTADDNGTPNVVLQAQFYDLDASCPVVECHVRFYVLDNSPHPKLHLLRIMDPNDELGGMVYPSIPTTATHHVDHHSMLCPTKHRTQPLVLDSHGMVLRSIDSAVASRDDIECPVCGETYGTYKRWIHHVRYNQMIEKRENYPLDVSHLGIDLSKFEGSQLPKISSIEELQNHFMLNLSEIIVVVEGIDPQLSGTFQALQSYRYEDIAWDCEFEPCLSVAAMGAGRASGRGYVVDMAKFHQVRSIHGSSSPSPSDPSAAAAGATVAAVETASPAAATTPAAQAGKSSNNNVVVGGNNPADIENSV